ncbi:MAG: BadF/BadG/BcrA/BcrD ATPase family protein [Nostocales cyanobacterium 94392]|nr:BadF/BadG/BcrA/BcrD ATPase family protein [Nostocales cyanobacterium 94392]
MVYVLGIDGGGSKTICVLMDDKRQILGRGEAGSSNYQSVGIEAAKYSIESAISKAIVEIENIQIQGICLGLAGVGRSSDIELIKNIIKNIPIISNIKPQNIIISHDALIALVGGIGNDVGIVVAAGTGSIVFGRNIKGETKRVGGWGYILGDEGGAYQIAVAGMQAALQAYDGREIHTSLIADFQNHLGLKNIEELIEVVYRRGWGVKEIAALAPVVDNAAVAGDEVANKIIDHAVDELVKATVTVIDEIFVERDFLELVTTGSVWKSRCKMWERFVSCINGKFGEVKVILPRFEAVYGAGLLALKSLGRG